jgi:membrane fusion protein, copper/silver efflux system
MKLGRIIALAAVLVAVFLGGVQLGYRRAVPRETTSSRRILHYICPMHPQYKSEKAGDCPSCGMALVPVYEGGRGAGSPSEASKPTSLPPGAFAVSAEKQQTIGIRLATVEKSGGTRTIRTVGRVAADGTRLYPVTASVGGWITAARPFTVGSFVKKNTTLATFYSPEVITTVRALLNVVNSKEWAEKSGEENPARQSQVYQFTQNLQQTRDTLRNQGMGELQLDRLVQTRKWDDIIEVPAPADGFIVTRDVVEGQRFRSGDEFYRIADLSRVWILVDVFEQEEKYLRAGGRVRVTLPRQGLTLSATVSDVLPQFDPVSRTLKVRLEATNPDFRLRPDMFVDVELPAELDPTLTVPADAIVDSGLRKTVYVDRGHGYFEPRQVETGWRIGDRVQILKGLMEGERIVISGNFLLDSESRMKAAAAGLNPATVEIDPICGMEVDPARARAAGRTSVYKSTTYYFCADDCKKQFDANPGKYATK